MTIITSGWTTDSLVFSLTLLDLRIACSKHCHKFYFCGNFIFKYKGETISSEGMKEDDVVDDFITGNYVDYELDQARENIFGVRYNSDKYTKMPFRLPGKLNKKRYVEAQESELLVNLASIDKIVAERELNKAFWVDNWSFWKLDTTRELDTTENDFGLYSYVIGGSYALSKIVDVQYDDIDYFTCDFKRFVELVIIWNGDFIAHNNVVSTVLNIGDKKINIVCLLSDDLNCFDRPVETEELIEMVHALIDISCTACFLSGSIVKYNSLIETKRCVGRALEGRVEKYKRKGHDFEVIEYKKGLLYYCQ